MTDIAAGIARFLTDTEGRPVTVDNVVPVSAGARRSNVLLDAHDGDRTVQLVATITPAACTARSTRRGTVSPSTRSDSRNDPPT